MKKFLLGIVILIGAAVLAISLSQSKQATETFLPLDPENREHRSLYFDATRTWNSELKAKEYNPQFINGENVGSASKVSLSWKLPNDVFNHYLITVTNPDSGWTRTESGESGRTELTLSELLPNEKYTFVLQACFDPACKEWFVSEKEEVFRTPQQFFKETDLSTSFAAPTYTLSNEVPQTLDKSTMRFLHKDGGIFTDEELETIKLHKILIFKNDLAKQFAQITFNSGGANRTIITQLINQ